MSQPTNLRTGVANHKKAELDALESKVESAQYQVNQMQAVVDSLTTKSSNFAGFLQEAEQNKSTALNNLNLASKAKNSLEYLTQSSAVANKETVKAAGEITQTTSWVSVLINKLIFSVEVIDKLNQQLVQQKQLNPLIPDQLVTTLAKAATDANNAVATTLTALTNCYAAEATGQESLQATTLTHEQAASLYIWLTKGADGNKSGNSLYELLEQAYTKANDKYQFMLKANNQVVDQLSYAQSQLANATTQLNSLKAGLAAAQSAAYAA